MTPMTNKTKTAERVVCSNCGETFHGFSACAPKVQEEPRGVTVIEALQNAREMLEANGIRGGDVYDDLHLAISRLLNKYPATATEEL